MSTSEVFASSRTSSWPSGFPMLIVIDFLPRLAEVNYAESLLSRPSLSFTQGGPKARESSPAPGRSTLMTSAPRSARFCPAQGPASTRERSRTRMCESGPAMSFQAVGDAVFYPKASSRPSGTLQLRRDQGARNAGFSAEGDVRGRALRAAPRSRAAAAVRLRARETLGGRGRAATRRGRAGLARGAADREIPGDLCRGEEREERDHSRARPGRASGLRPDRRAARAPRRSGLHHAFDPDADPRRGRAAGALSRALLGSGRALRRRDDLSAPETLRQDRGRLAQHGLAHGEPLHQRSSAGPARGLDLPFHLERGHRAVQEDQISRLRRLRGKRLRPRAAGRAETRRGAQAHARFEPDHGVRDRSLFRQEGKRAGDPRAPVAGGREEVATRRPGGSASPDAALHPARRNPRGRLPAPRARPQKLT